jgi:hypothetical protein
MSCLSDFAFDSLLAGELDGEGQAHAHGHVASCRACADRLAAVASFRARFLSAPPPLAALEAGKRPAQRPRAQPVLVRARPAGAFRWLLGVGGAVAAAGLLLSLAGGTLLPDAPSLAAGGVRLKGGPRLGVKVVDGAGGRVIGPGDAVPPGSTVQFSQTSGTPGYLAVCGVAGGRARAYHPGTGHAAPVAPGRDLPVGPAVALDGVAGAEELVGVFCPDPIPVERAVKLAGGTSETGDCHLDRIPIEKGVR